ncbi:hypothetical protein HAZT_HAZT003453 [Hyalella azteca]|uniref:Deubiquitinating enzyme MINDY-3/4 conserved domain-containing protein n=1 Tax=Hyalella azteca TaxID=294128 RepID=A0A6A0HG44_HYAAZ|nr:hypothetical protein HAZT_HAZT003453 [Hyalella azteca]
MGKRTWVTGHVQWATGNGRQSNKRPALPRQIVGMTMRSDIGILTWTPDADDVPCPPPTRATPSLVTLSTVSTRLRGLVPRYPVPGSPRGGGDEEGEEGDEVASNFGDIKHREVALRLGVGSRLKTPRFPVWVTLCNLTYGLLLNPNRDLTRDYHAENRRVWGTGTRDLRSGGLGPGT